MGIIFDKSNVSKGYHNLFGVPSKRYYIWKTICNGPFFLFFFLSPWNVEKPRFSFYSFYGRLNLFAIIEGDEWEDEREPWTILNLPAIVKEERKIHKEPWKIEGPVLWEKYYMANEIDQRILKYYPWGNIANDCEYYIILNSDLKLMENLAFVDEYQKLTGKKV